MTDHDDERLRRMLDHYNTPPPVPTDSLWSAIASAPEPVARTRRLLRLPVTWAAAAALTLFALGIAAGAALTSSSPLDPQPQLTDEATEAGQDNKLVIWF